MFEKKFFIIAMSLFGALVIHAMGVQVIFQNVSQIFGETYLSLLNSFEGATLGFIYEERSYQMASFN